MRPKTITLDPANVDADGLAAANDSSGTSLTLDGTLTSGGTFTSADGLGRQLSITDTATVDQSGATFTVTGTDADGKVQTEALLGPASTATVETTKYFKTVTSVTIASGAVSGTVNMGTVDEFASSMIPMDWYRENAPLVSINVTGTISLDVQLTSDNPLTMTGDQESLLWIDDDNLAAVTADGHSSVSDWPVKAIRIIANSYTDTAEATIELTQAF